MRRWMTVTILLLLLTACKMGPNYTRPETPSGDSWRMVPATSESIANLPWWELLKDLELQKLIRIALKENQDVRVAAANVAEFQAQLIIAKFDLAPSLGYGGQTFTFKTQTNTFPIPAPGGGAVFIPGLAGRSGSQTLSNESGFAGLKWELDLWGRIRRSIEAAHAQLLSSEESQRAVILGLVSNMAEAYFDLRALDLQVEITKRTLKTWEDSVQLARLRYTQGVISKLDMDRFDAERAGTAAKLANLEKQVVQKENQLSVLLGRKPNQITRGVSLTEQVMPPAVPAGLPSDLLQRRPDILQAEQQLAGATANIGVAQALRFPQLSLTGALGVASTQLSSLSLGPMFTQMAGASVAGPLFNATSLGYQVKAAEAKTEQAVAQYEKAIVTAFKEVEDALIAVQKSREEYDAQQQQVVALQSAVSLADLRYHGGFASYLEVLTAQRTLFDAELALAGTRRTQLVSVVQLYKALGGGWPPNGATALSSSRESNP